MPYTESTCLTTTGSFNAIPDNGCASNAPARVSLTQSGLPNTLGTSPGNARLLSVELIVSHSYNADLEIRLISPTGQSRNLILDRFGNGDNLGDPSNCPWWCLGAAGWWDGPEQHQYEQCDRYLCTRTDLSRFHR